MRTVAEQLAACLEIAQSVAPLDVLLPDAVGCVLAEDIVAELDLLVVDLAGVDGYAVVTAETRGASTGLPGHPGRGGRRARR